MRPGYGYDKFYLDWIDGSYEYSLQGLIHFILYEDGYFKKILSPKTYKKVEAFYKSELAQEGNLFDFYDDDRTDLPFDEIEKEDEIVQTIIYDTICNVQKLFEKYGLPYDKESFEDTCM